MIGHGESRSLIDELLETQQRLTAVERFAERHERGALPDQARYYRELIPADLPRPGEQYAFAVDLDACTGCKACVSACHSLNGLEDDELWRGVGLLHGGTQEEPYQQTVTTACHHCLDPACANGCPVLAYEKDPDTGIVRHLDDQCIGCQYCLLKCPYDVPKFSRTKGIVRKCDMCHGRLVLGEAPACVQACPNEAITISVIDQAQLAQEAAAGRSLLPGTFDRRYTKPATQFTSDRRIPPNARPADDGVLRLEPPHWPLTVMLILTQLAAGVHAMHALLLNTRAPAALDWTAGIGLAALLAGLLASFTHLGRPLKAWRVFLGLKRSWMSREIAAFSVYAAGAGALAFWPAVPALAHSVALLGVVSVVCSAMIYIDTHRPFWNAGRTLPRFLGTAALLGPTTGAALFGWTNPAIAPACAIAATVVRTLLFAWDWISFLAALRNSDSPAHRSALVVARLQQRILAARVMLFVTSTLFSAMAIAAVAALGAVWGTIAFITTVTSQILERYTYFTASATPRMPGGVSA